MAKSSATKDAQALFHSLRSAYAATPTNLKVTVSLLDSRAEIYIHTAFKSIQFQSIFTYCCWVLIELFLAQIIDLYVIFAISTALIQVFTSTTLLSLIYLICMYPWGQSYCYRSVIIRFLLCLSW